MQISAMINVLPAFQRKRDVIVYGEQSVGDIMIEVINAHERYASHYDNLVGFFNGDVPRKLFQFCQTHLPYREESDQYQQTKSPSAILQSGKMKNDCKHYAGFIAGVLDAMNRAGLSNYDWRYMFVNYKKESDKADHVFVIVDDDIWIDPTPIKDRKTGRYLSRTFNDRMMIPVNYRDDLKPETMLSSLHGLHYYVANEDISQPTMCNMNGANYNGNNVGFAWAAVLPAIQTATGGGGGLTAATGAATSLADSLPDGGLKDWVKSFMSDPTGAIKQIFTGRTYTSGDYRLGEVYMRNILGMMEIQRRGQVPDSYVPQAWSFFTLALGVPIGSLDHIDQLVIGAQNYKSWNNNSFSWVPDDQAQRANKILNQYIGWTPSYYPRDVAWQLSKFNSIPYIYPVYDIWDGQGQPRLYTGTHPITGQSFVGGYPYTASQPQSPIQPTQPTQPVQPTQPAPYTPTQQTPGGTLYPPATQPGSNLLPIVLVGGLALLLLSKNKR